MKKVLVAIGITGGALCIITAASILVSTLIAKQEMDEYEDDDQYC